MLNCFFIELLFHSKTINKCFLTLESNLTSAVYSMSLYILTVLLPVFFWRKYVHEVLVNRLGGLSLPRKSVVRLTDRPDMT